MYIPDEPHGGRRATPLILKRRTPEKKPVVKLDIQMDGDSPLTIVPDILPASSSSRCIKQEVGDEDLDIKMEVYLPCKLCGLNFLTYQNLDTHIKRDCVMSMVNSSSSLGGGPLTIDLNKKTDANKVPPVKTARKREKIRPKIQNEYLATLALKHSSKGKLNIEKIYKFITINFPYFRIPQSRLEQKEGGNWKRQLHADLKQSANFTRTVVTCTPSNACKPQTGTRVLWSIEATKVKDMDRKMMIALKQNKTQILRTMEHPQDFMLMMEGKLQVDLDTEEEEDQEEQDKRTAAIIANFFAKPEAKKSNFATTSLVQTTTTAGTSSSSLIFNDNRQTQIKLVLEPSAQSSTSIQRVKRPVPGLIPIDGPPVKILKKSLPITILTPKFAYISSKQPSD